MYDVAISVHTNLLGVYQRAEWHSNRDISFQTGEFFFPDPHSIYYTQT